MFTASLKGFQATIRVSLISWPGFPYPFRSDLSRLPVPRLPDTLR